MNVTSVTFRSMFCFPNLTGTAAQAITVPDLLRNVQRRIDFVFCGRYIRAVPKIDRAARLEEVIDAIYTACVSQKSNLGALLFFLIFVPYRKTAVVFREREDESWNARKPKAARCVNSGFRESSVRSRSPISQLQRYFTRNAREQLRTLPFRGFALASSRLVLRTSAYRNRAKPDCAEG